MAMRCFGRARLAGACARPFALRSLALIVFRAVDLVADLAAALRAGDFFCAAVRLAARDVGFCLAIDVLPFRYEERLARIALRRVGKGALAPCPPWQLSALWWARC